MSGEGYEEILFINININFKLLGPDFWDFWSGDTGLESGDQTPLLLLQVWGEILRLSVWSEPAQGEGSLKM